MALVLGLNQKQKMGSFVKVIQDEFEISMVGELTYLKARVIEV